MMYFVARDFLSYRKYLVTLKRESFSYKTKPSGRIRTRVSGSSQQRLTTLGVQSVQAPHE